MSDGDDDDGCCFLRGACAEKESGRHQDARAGQSEEDKNGLVELCACACVVCVGVLLRRTMMSSPRFGRRQDVGAVGRPPGRGKSRKKATSIGRHYGSTMPRGSSFTEKKKEQKKSSSSSSRNSSK